ncbi:MAG TPA: pyridoxal-phosphate dependent enzyme [Solirubrobacteraceae bacterium]|jgi:threonine dehydratase|nr:pyridoxal-phosphate dependent enzyme [Solirubrobacteraceae bacterium]
MSDAEPGARDEAVPEPADLIAAVDVERARQTISGAVRRTPTLASEELSERAGGASALKAESLQRTGSFKLRGALNKVDSLGARAAAGLVTASAGNHGRAVAEAARLRGVACEVFMPRDAAVSKVAAVEGLGARVTLAGSSVDDAVELALAKEALDGPAFVHPFDDLAVIAGQGTLGLELLEEVPDLARVVVPVGGGGLASGIAIALRRGRPQVQIVGVQARVCAPYARAFAGAAVTAEPSSGATIADGIALKHPGRLTLALLRELLADIETVTEDEIAEAMVFLASSAKLVAEGAGAVAVAALRSGRLPPVAGSTVAIVSGGNVDSGLLANLLRRHETHQGRRVRIFTRVADRPGGLAELLNLVAGARANLVSLEHVRDAVQLAVRETGVELTLETRGPHHTDDLLAALAQAGYEVHVE